MSNRIALSFALIFSIFSTSLYAQKDGTGESAKEKSSKTDTTKKQLLDINIEKPFNAKKARKTADKQVKSGNIYQAYELYEEIIENDPDNTPIAWKLAETYRAARDYKNALRYYNLVKESQSLSYPTAEYMYAMMLKMTEQYKEAKDIFVKLSKKYKGENSSLIRKWSKLEAQGCDFGIASLASPVPADLTHLEKNVNSNYSDFAPVIFDENTILYTSLPTDTAIMLEGKTTDYYLKLYKSKFENGSYSKGEIYHNFNAPDMHTANGALSPDKKRFYFTRCKEEKGFKPICKIWMSEQVDGAWQEPVELGINSPTATNTQPTVTSYKNDQEILYFVSDRDGGRGGLDIWYSLISKKGDHRTPYNCGSRINSDRNEYSPFYDSKNGVLYFSSEGHITMGGMDVVKAVGAVKKWTKPENLGAPINSSCDDMYYVLEDNQKEGYFVTNRPGVYALKSETCCDDIFRFKYKKIINVAVQGFVYEKGDETKTPINEAAVTLKLTGSESGEDVPINEDTTADNKMYFFPLQIGKYYKISGQKDGYLTNSVEITTLGITESDTLRADLYLQKLVKDKAYRLKNIYYDYDKWFLRDASKATLDTLYDILTQNPTIIVEIGSHTDIRGSDTYNRNLSQKRAESCVNYLIEEKKIPKERLEAKGYGESKTLEDCTKVTDCPDDGKTDCPCHQDNRRTEFKIIGELDAELIYEDERVDEPAQEKQDDKGKRGK